MPTYWPIVLIGLVAAGLLAWSLARQRRRSQDQKALLDQLGFRPCPEEKSRLDEIVTAIERDRHHRYEVQDPKRLPREPSVYYYVKVCDAANPREAVTTEEELLFRLKRPPAGALVLFVKPSSLAPGVATRLIGAVATGPWDTQPDDLERLGLPPDLRDANLFAALGPPGASLYDLVDGRTIDVVQGLGDAGAMCVQFRNGWCSIASAGQEVPFRLDEILTRIRPLL